MSHASGYPADYAAKPALLERILRVFVLRGYLREHRDDIHRHDRRKFVRRGWDKMVYGSYHKSLKTMFDWSETLTLSCKLLKRGCDWLSRSQTTVETTDNRT